VARLPELHRTSQLLGMGVLLFKEHLYPFACLQSGSEFIEESNSGKYVPLHQNLKRSS
jgi:hypothetical protein